MPSGTLRSELKACRTGLGISAVASATVWLSPSGRSTLSRSRVARGFPPTFERISPRIR